MATYLVCVLLRPLARTGAASSLSMFCAVITNAWQTLTYPKEFVDIHCSHPARNRRSMTTEKWQCFNRWDNSRETVLVELTLVTGDGEDRGFGEVSVAGVTYRALFRLAGFNRRWGFGEELNYAFIIRPDGDGQYYDFSTVEDGGKTEPGQHFEYVSP